MARVKDNILTQGLSGSINKQLVYRTRNGRTYVSKYPKMDQIVPTERQLQEKSKFSAAVKYAQSLLAKPEEKAALLERAPEGRTAYHQAIKEYYLLLKSEDQ